MSDVPESTLVAVLGALGVPAATEDERAAALAAHDRDYWSRALPPTIVARADSDVVVLGARHPRRSGRPVDSTGGRQCARGLRQLENDTPPYDLDGRLIGEATFELPDDLPLGYHRLTFRPARPTSSTPLIVSPATLELPAAARCQAGRGVWPPSSTACTPQDPGASAI